MHLAGLDTNQLKAAAAQVGDQAIGFRKRRDNPIAGGVRLGLPAEDFSRQAERADSGEEFSAICRLTHGCGSDNLNRQRLHQAQHRSKPGKSGQRQRRAFGIKPAASNDAAAKASHQLLVEQHHWRTRPTTEHNQPDRV